MRIRRALWPLAWTLVACVLLTAGWTAFMVADPFSGHRQQALQEHLARDWGQAAPPAGVPSGSAHPGSGARPSPDRIRLATGQPFAFIKVPAFGRDWKFAIVEGTGAAQLALGPGHVRGSQLPGQRGNFVVAAHDVTAGNPFQHLASLRYPDKAYIYTRSLVYEYVIRSEKVVRYTDVGVQYPVPGHPSQAPHRALITLITCTPETLQFTPWRVVVTGELVRVSARS